MHYITCTTKSVTWTYSISDRLYLVKASSFPDMGDVVGADMSGIGRDSIQALFIHRVPRLEHS